ncbi:RNA polymerase sigma factor [Candidatus Sumerlaeota bacterium]|nr:RNA polymerase sigma factor [Candidatus Sumerlaeota bacterium]
MVFCSPFFHRNNPAELFAGLFPFSSFMRDQEKSSQREITNEEDLRDIQKVLGGKTENFKQLIERHQSMVSSMMRRFTRNPELHEELVQDVFVEVYFSLSSYKAKAPFSHWLARIATRAGYRFWKKRDREARIETVPLLETDRPLYHPATKMNPADAAETLHDLLNLLPPRDRLIITLRFVDDRSVEETARMTGWSEIMVKVQTWRAKSKLKKILLQKGVKTRK